MTIHIIELKSNRILTKRYTADIHLSFYAIVVYFQSSVLHRYLSGTRVEVSNYEVPTRGT